MTCIYVGDTLCTECNDQCYMTLSRCDGVHNIRGERVERDQYQYPYSYEPYAVYVSKDFQPTDKSVYSDRIREWDQNKYNEVCKVIWPGVAHATMGYHASRDPDTVERFLSLYFDKNIKLTGIEEACNYANGYRYYIWYYKVVD